MPGLQCQIYYTEAPEKCRRGECGRVVVYVVQECAASGGFAMKITKKKLSNVEFTPVKLKITIESASELCTLLHWSNLEVAKIRGSIVVENFCEKLNFELQAADRERSEL
jgi:hypothetical protein